MQLQLIEASNGFNHGKFAVGYFTAEQWAQPSALPGQQHRPLLGQTCGWTPLHAWVLDLQTGEGAMFRLGGHASNDLRQHRIWVCPLFEPFLQWLYQHYRDQRAASGGFSMHDIRDWVAGLPGYVSLPDAPGEFHGYRRAGPGAEIAG